jgi:hypothetical protein
LRACGEVCYNGPVETAPTRMPMLNKIIPAVACLAAALLLFTFGAGRAQQESAVFYAETGHYVAEPFLSAFQAAGDEAAWGAPITEAFEENGLLVQYFERTRLECAEQAEGPCEPHLSPLAEMLSRQTPRVPSVPDSMMGDGLCRYFSETGHNVCFSFLRFYLDKGGPDLLGPPISELTVGHETLSQCFRRACIVWHTDVPVDEALQLAPLGREYFAAKDLEPSLLAAVDSPGAVVSISADIALGSEVRVVDTEGAGLRMRDGPGLSYGAVETLQEGALLQVIGGPHTADGFTWWQVQTDANIGWCASDWLTPIESNAVP